MIEKLKKFYSIFSSHDHVIILIFADPDSMACAMAVKRLLWRKTASVTIGSVNRVDRPDNISMIRLLDIKMLHISKIKPSDYSKCVILDSQPDHNEHYCQFSPDVVIDHHPVNLTSTSITGFTDIRPEYGACATILTEYLRTAKIKPTMKLATGLFHAIKTDTDNFARTTTIEDIRAFQYLYTHANIHLANRIEHAEIRPGFLKYYSLALTNKIIRKHHILSHLGKVNNPDICVLIADFFMKIDTITWSIVSGIYNKKLIVIIRNDGDRKDAGNIAKKAFEKYGSAGGHKSMARAEVPIAELKKSKLINNQKEIAGFIIEHMETVLKK